MPSSQAQFDPSPYTGIAGIDAFRVRGLFAWDKRVADLPRGLSIGVLQGGAPAPTAEVSREWDRLCDLNPRLYNGPLLAVVSADLELGEFVCRRDDFRRLVVQPRVRTGVRLLAVSGVVTARDASGREHVLLGRRGSQTRIYAGMWEIGPSGGVPPPPINVSEVDEGTLHAALIEEGSEEVGMTLRPGAILGLARDHVAMSEDVFVHCDAGRLEDALDASTPTSAWEYAETMWLPIDAVREFDDANGREVIAASRAMFRVLGWIDET